MQRCFLLALALVAPAAADEGPQDFGAVQMQLGNVMRASQEALSNAEKHHEKIVNDVRDDVEQNFDDQAHAMADAVTEYEQELINAEAQLEMLVNVSKIGLADAAKAPGADDWEGPNFMEKAKLGAELSAAERALKKMRRQRPNLVHQAQEQVEEPLGDEEQQLGMVVGDLSKDMDNSKDTIANYVEYVEDSKNMTRNATRDATQYFVGEKAKTAKEETVLLQDFEAGLKDAVKQSSVAADKALAKLGKVIEQETKDQKNQTEVMEKRVKDAEKTEVSSVSGMSKKMEKAIAKAVPKARAAPKAKAAPKTVKVAKETPKAKAPAKEGAPAKGVAAKVVAKAAQVTPKA